ncbi:type II toxin-antitoxin system PemK/MazF family toxin [Amycolatopsis pithecellobii]|nr:type II toxin-antitoxin system PemK/MazF family toxin [Amycolatopsis pithecellobii]
MRPVVVLTRELVRPHLTRVTVAPITATVRGISTEVAVGAANGLDHESVISCDNIHTISKADLGRHLGFLLSWQERELAVAIRNAFDLE